MPPYTGLLVITPLLLTLVETIYYGEHCLKKLFFVLGYKNQTCRGGIPYSIRPKDRSLAAKLHSPHFRAFLDCAAL